MENGQVFDPYLSVAMRGIDLDMIPDNVDSALLERRAALARGVRSSVTRLLKPLTGLPEGVSWAIYDVDPKPLEEVNEGEYPEFNSVRELCVIVIKDPLRKKPLIKMYANEIVTVSEDYCRCLSEELTIDDENDALYSNGVVQLDDRDIEHYPPPENITEDRGGSAENGTPENLVESYAPTFQVDDENRLDISDYVELTPVLPVEASGEIDNDVTPFGSWKEITHHIDALVKAKEMLAELKGAERLACGTQDTLEY